MTEQLSSRSKEECLRRALVDDRRKFSKEKKYQERILYQTKVFFEIKKKFNVKEKEEL